MGKVSHPTKTGRRMRLGLARSYWGAMRGNATGRGPLAASDGLVENSLVRCFLEEQIPLAFSYLMEPPVIDQRTPSLGTRPNARLPRRRRVGLACTNCRRKKSRVMQCANQSPAISLTQMHSVMDIDQSVRHVKS